MESWIWRNHKINLHVKVRNFAELAPNIGFLELECTRIGINVPRKWKWALPLIAHPWFGFLQFSDRLGTHSMKHYRHTFRLHHANPVCIHCEARRRHHVWDGWKLSYSRTYPYEYAKGRLNQSSATLPAEAAGNQSESQKSSLNLDTRSSCQWPIYFIVTKKNVRT